jgi:type IV secretory pathway TrbD component
VKNLEGRPMDKRVTKITVISIIITIAIIFLVMGAEDWFGIDFGVFKWIIFAVAVVVCNIIAASQATKVERERKSK